MHIGHKCILPLVATTSITVDDSQQEGWKCILQDTVGS